MDTSSVINAVTTLLMGNLMVIAPSLIVGLVAAIVASAFLAMTQLQEQSIAFILKLSCIIFIFVFTGNWMLTRMVELMSAYFKSIPSML